MALINNNGLLVLGRWLVLGRLDRLLDSLGERELQVERRRGVQIQLRAHESPYTCLGRHGRVKECLRLEVAVLDAAGCLEDGVHLGVGHRVGNLDRGRRCHDIASMGEEGAWHFTLFAPRWLLNDRRQVWRLQKLRRK